VFEHLEDLDIALPLSDASPTSNWVMPRLQRLRFDLGNSPLSGATFLKAFGRKLFSLLLYFTSHNSSAMQHLLDCCPALEHLAMGPAPRASMPPLKHVTINWVDVFYHLGERERTTFESLKDGFPDLRTFRTFDTSMSPLRNIPDTISPREIGSHLDSISGAHEDGLWIRTVLSSIDSRNSREEGRDDSCIPEGAWVAAYGRGT
jgi:hypothetical protein